MSNCPNKERCGSCSWSHIPYEGQLKQKLSDINGSLRLKDIDLICDEIIPSPITEHYRNRMDFVIDFERRVGLREKGKWWRVIDDHYCFISEKRIENLISMTREWVKSSPLPCYDRKAHCGVLRYAVVRTTLVGESMIIVVTSKPSDECEEKLIDQELQRLASETQTTSLIWSINSTLTDVSFGDEIRVIKGERTIRERILDFDYYISPNAFFQTNSYASPLLLKEVIDRCADLSSKVLLDLYCGSGFFSIALGNKAQDCVGVELVQEAIRDAKYNAAQNNSKVRYFDSKTEDFDWKTLGADTVIVDPPRSGMHDKALKALIDIRPKRIVFVSCNYKHFAHSMIELQKHYMCESIRAIDMFPHTPHVELVAQLDCRS